MAIHMGVSGPPNSLAYKQLLHMKFYENKLPVLKKQRSVMFLRQRFDNVVCFHCEVAEKLDLVATFRLFDRRRVARDVSLILRHGFSFPAQ